MEKSSTVNPLEQFVLLAKSAKGAAAVELIKQVLETPGVYVFGELLDSHNIKELNGGPHTQYWELLNLFAYDTCQDYKENKEKYPSLTPSQINKLRHLTIVSLATKNKCLPYTLLLKELDVANLRELEDLIIEVICADVIRGKLDQKYQRLEVDYAIGRDTKPLHVKEMISVLEDWCNCCESVLNNIDVLAVEANDAKETHLKHLQKTEQEIASIKKSLKTIQQDQEEHISIDIMPSTSDKLPKKSKSKSGLRGSASSFNASPKSSK